MKGNTILKDLATIIDCEHKTAPLETEGIPSIRTPNIGKGRLLLEGVNRVSEKTYQLWTKRAKPESGDLILAREAPVGNAAIITYGLKVCLGQRTVLIKPNKAKISSEYLNYLINSYAVNNYLINISVGATVGHLNVTDIRNLKLPLLPPLPVQRKIAAIISTYDDLIEINNSRITILEKMAADLYREWFVRLRFPGQEKAKIVKGVPGGWRVVELNKIAIEVSTSTKPGTHLENRFYLPIDLLQQKRFNPESHQSYENAQSSLVTFEKNDILFGAMRPYLHKVCIAPFNGITRTTCFVIRPLEKRFYSYLYLLLFQNSTIEYATLICNGADRPYVVWNKAFERMLVFKPADDIVFKFDKLIRPMFAQISNTYFILQNLKELRGHLLSRLMSGKMDVEKLNIQFPMSMLENSDG